MKDWTKLKNFMINEPKSTPWFKDIHVWAFIIKKCHLWSDRRGTWMLHYILPSRVTTVRNRKVGSNLAKDSLISRILVILCLKWWLNIYAYFTFLGFDFSCIFETTFSLIVTCYYCSASLFSINSIPTLQLVQFFRFTWSNNYLIMLRYL